MAIPSATVAKAGERIAEHARQHALAGVRVILHGGEPLLVAVRPLGEPAWPRRDFGWPGAPTN